MKAFRHYRATGEALPDFFLIVDDDTYFNMELFRREHEWADASRATFHAGCLVRFPVWQVNFTFPFGGFGSILGRGALANLFRPIWCPQHTPACARLREDTARERQYFTNGMTLVELMYRYTSTEKYQDVARWTAGFCMHSDWVLGYFANFYNVSEHVAEPFYRDVPHARIEGYKGSEIYRKPYRRLCRNDPLHDGGCEADTELCHRATPRWMAEETARWRNKTPEGFRRRAALGP